MPLRMEIWLSGRLIGGIEEWWDSVDDWIYAEKSRKDRFPVLSSFDGYTIASIPGSQFSDLRAELIAVTDEAPNPVRAITRRVVELLSSLDESRTVNLRLIGD